MCGISLVHDPEAAGDSILDALAVMHQDLAGRGPDGEGWLLIDAALNPFRSERRPDPADRRATPIRCAAAFRRLAIRDTRQEANQPISWQGGRRWILHNGEIYNDRD